MAKIELIIGIDPGTTTGVALYDEVSDTLLELHTMDFWSAFTWCSMSSAKIVCIEVPKNKRIFHAFTHGGNFCIMNTNTALDQGGGNIRQQSRPIQAHNVHQGFFTTLGR